MPVNDLWRCRLVNKQWNSLAISQLQKDLQPLSIQKAIPMLSLFNPVGMQAPILDSMETVINKVNPVPWVKFEIKGASKAQAELGEPVLYKFLGDISSWVQHITLHHNAIPGEAGIFTRKQINLQFPCLTQLKFMAGGADMSMKLEVNLHLLHAILSNAPRVKKLTLDNAREAEVITRFSPVGSCCQPAKPGCLGFGWDSGEHACYHAY